MNFLKKNQEYRNSNKNATCKTLLLSIALIFSTTLCNAQKENQTISVIVNNVTNNKGKVIFGLHTYETFMKSESIQNAEVKIENGKATALFKNIKPGTYAIMVLHDENENHQMDYNENGMPAEHYGMSNNPMSYGPPQFMDAKFEVVQENLEFLIRF